MRKRGISLLLAVLMAFGLCGPLGVLVPEAGAAEIIAQGDTHVEGDIHWELDSEGTFTLSGDGRPPMVSASLVITPWDDYKDQIRRVVIEEGVWGTGEYSFSGCTNLTEVEFPSNFTYIADSTFSGCTGLTSIRFPSSLRKIGSGAFSGCTGLTELDFPSSLESIGSWAFSGCTGLTEADIPPDVGIGTQAFIGCTGLKKVILSDGNSVGQAAFSGCKSLTEVYWPLSLASADQYFSNGSGQLTVYYEGSEADWDDIGIPYLGQKIPEGTTVHYNCDMPLWVDDTQDDTPVSVIPTPILDDPVCDVSGVRISWTVPLETLDRKNVRDGYYVFRKTGGGDYQRIGELDEYSSMYMDTTVEEGQTYTYTVQAHYQGETGDYDQTGKTITYIKPQEEEETHSSAIINSYVQDHVWFAESEDYDERMDSRFAATIAEAQSSGVQMAAEIAYDILNTIDESTAFERLTIFDNPYDALITELLANMGDADSIQVALDTEMFSLSNSVLELIYKMQPDYVPPDTFTTDLMDLFKEPESFRNKHFTLYNTLESAIQSSVGEIGKEKTLNTLIKDLDTMGDLSKTLAVLGDAAELMDWVSDSCQYYLLVSTYVNLSESIRDVLRGAANKMSGTDAAEFRAALNKFEKFVSADNLAATFMATGDIAMDLGGRLYDIVGDEATEFLVTTYIETVTGTSVAVPLAAYHIGWAISNAITSNDQVVLSRTMIRANYSLEQAVYSILQDNRSALLDNPNIDTAHAFDAAFTMLRQCELYALREYQDYLNASQKSLVQGILHLGNRNSNSFEIAIADQQIIRWDLACCHGEQVSDQHLGCNALLFNNADQVELRNGTGKTLLETDMQEITEYGDVNVTGQLLCDDIFYLSIYENNLYNLRFSWDGEDPLVVMFIQFDEEMDPIKIQNYKIEGGGTVTGSLTTEVYGTGNGTLRLTRNGTDQIPIQQINNMDEMTMVQGISLAEPAPGTVTKGQAFRLEPQIQPANATLPDLCWSSSDPTVATVDSTGLVTPLSAGTVTIVAQAMDGSGCRLVYEMTVDGTLPTFTDVSSGSWYYDAVQWAVEHGVTAGTSANAFSPDQSCTRAQVVTFLWRAMGQPEADAEDNPFRDVSENAYYYDAVQWAVENGITTGTSANTFSPDESCTRAQVVTFLWRSTPQYKPTGSTGFYDVGVEDYFWYPVKWAVDEDITTGTSDTLFSPHETCTRAQVVTFLYRYLA